VQSSWTMAFLWLFVASEWLCFSWLFLSVWPGGRMARFRRVVHP
jgi:hypothetical protein